MTVVSGRIVSCRVVSCRAVMSEGGEAAQSKRRGHPSSAGSVHGELESIADEEGAAGRSLAAAGGKRRDETRRDETRRDEGGATIAEFLQRIYHNDWQDGSGRIMLRLVEPAGQRDICARACAAWTGLGPGPRAAGERTCFRLATHMGRMRQGMTGRATCAGLATREWESPHMASQTSQASLSGTCRRTMPSAGCGPAALTKIPRRVGHHDVGRSWRTSRIIFPCGHQGTRGPRQ
ncbi:uncharacterized protein B0I36DRAFT_337311 [Microdochium trichocladiopsis]|uniref:Uncharacterized protein n=1 Tax=Microdochium trichocladiopsis TaxID=1682393 RepID=A0A9P9BGR0_9PEZI|nr:uncharacterized protein B0I36DRAFT_337311 [Microdochium trichocladiopsis]KAH7016312.1 hypothetical protein B0I36DRAFT_337311 [Microdochium trichocladiopsis]